jgi:hypothetical protein
MVAAHNGPLSQYWHRLTDKTFSGVYHANSFDLAMMIPYFIVLFILAMYGLHRYVLLYDYFAKMFRLRPRWLRTGQRLPYSFPSSTSAT